MLRRAAIVAFAFVLLCRAEEAEDRAAMAGEAENVDSLYAQALMMLNDRTIRDVSAVPEMLETCAKQEHLPACMLLLDVYEGTRVGIQPDPEKAFKLANYLANKEYDAMRDHVTKAEWRSTRNEALFRLALFYERGIGCKASARNALVCMLRAAKEGGLPKARAEVARYLMKGVGCKPDPEGARKLLTRLAQRAPRTPNIFFYLGHIFANGLGMHGPSMRMACRMYELGERVQDARAINNLATMYECGRGVPQDFSRALSLYKKAATLGCKEASANVQRLAYKADVESDTPWRLRVYHAAHRVVRALPLSQAFADWLEQTFFTAGEKS